MSIKIWLHLLLSEKLPAWRKLLIWLTSFTSVGARVGQHPNFAHKSENSLLTYSKIRDETLNLFLIPALQQISGIFLLLNQIFTVS